MRIWLGGASQCCKLVVGWHSLCGASERLAPDELPRERDAPTTVFFASLICSPKQPQSPQLIAQIARIIENENVGLTDLLMGLDAEQEAILQ